MTDSGEIIIYAANDGVHIDVRLEGDTVWLNQAQIAELFGTQRPAITKHLRNIFVSHELDKDSVCSVLEHTAADGKRYQTQYYNLDAVISVGYRVNSVNATRFRIWANRILKDYLVRGYALNAQRLKEQSERIGAFLFIWFLQRNRHHLKPDGSVKINDNALTAIALLVAQSDPAQKDIMIRLIMNLIRG